MANQRFTFWPSRSLWCFSVTLNIGPWPGTMKSARRKISSRLWNWTLGFSLTCLQRVSSAMSASLSKRSPNKNTKSANILSICELRLLALWSSSNRKQHIYQEAAFYTKISFSDSNKENSKPTQKEQRIVIKLTYSNSLERLARKKSSDEGAQIPYCHVNSKTWKANCLTVDHSNGSSLVNSNT